MGIYKFIIFLSVVWLFCINNSYAEWCKYSSEITECKEANTNWTVKSIEDFVCITGTSEKIAYQIILDKEFSEVDKEMDEFIEILDKNKNTYFWVDRQKTYIDGINDIHAAKDYFYNAYKNLCWINIVNELTACTETGNTSIRNASNYFKEWDCMLLVEKKLEIFDDVTFAVLMLNKEQIKADDKKIYDQWQRKNYNVLLDIMMINLWYLERIWNKWPMSLANPMR